MQNHEYFYPEKYALPLALEAPDTYLHALLVSTHDVVLPFGAKPIRTSPFEEDSKDIDALLSLEGEELEGYDEEELSTASTNKNCESIHLVDVNGVRARMRKILWYQVFWSKQSNV